MPATGEVQSGFDRDSKVVGQWKPRFRPEWTPEIANVLRSQEQPVFSLLDAARDPHVRGLLIVEDIECQSLYAGPEGDDLADFAPYLVRLSGIPRLLDVLVRDGWGKSWGVFLTTTQPLSDVRRHFRRFLLAETPKGNEVLFRFYDPRVLRVFLPHCNAEEAAAFFGSVSSFLMEGELPGTMLRYTAATDGVKQETIAFGPCVDAARDLPWVQAVLDNFSDLPEEERLDLLRGWQAALPVPATAPDRVYR